MLLLVASGCEDAAEGLKSFEDTASTEVTTPGTTTGTTPAGTTGTTTIPGVETDCSDGIDNDEDGRPDCFDTDCDSVCDADGDGERGLDYDGEDCDDTNPDIYPGAVELCNGFDDDCDMRIDDDDPDMPLAEESNWWPDLDEDGYGDEDAEVLKSCAQRPLTADNFADCNDEEPLVNPDGIEVCNGLDDDCDGLFDDDDPDTDVDLAPIWYPDNDLDGFGVPSDDAVQSCAPPEPTGWSLYDTDCDDEDPTTGPTTDWWPDTDGDGFGAGDPLGVSECEAPADGLAPVWRGEDCDDRLADFYPGAEDTCEDGLDQDCDGEDPGCARYMYAATAGMGPYDLWEIDTDLGTVRMVGPIGVAITSMDFLPDGTLFGIGGGGIAHSRAEAGKVFTIDTTTGAATEWFTAPGGLQEGAIAYLEGRIWKIDQFDDVFDLDAATLMGVEYDFPADALTGYGKDFAASADGRLFYGGERELYEVDRSTGEFSSLVAPSGLPGSNQGAGFTFHDGELWGFSTDGVVTRLVTVDLVTGIASPTGLEIPAIRCDALASPTR
jgi:hypothetical protein